MAPGVYSPKRMKSLARNLLGEVCCAWCGTISHLTVHHIVPRSKGGTDAIINRMVLCTPHHKAIHRKVPAKQRLKQAQLKRVMPPPGIWVPISQPPVDNTDVIAGHALGKWVQQEVLFIEDCYRVRHNANLGGIAGYKQKDTKTPEGKPASPDAWLWGAKCFPTHWMLPPNPPMTAR